MTDNTTELDFGTTAQKATDAEKLPVVLLALDQGRYDMARSLDELRALADANGMDAVAEVVQKRATPEAATLLGEGKVAEARLVCQNVNAAAAIFDGELTGSQIRNLSAALQVEVLDRTMLILEIFRARATTNEGKLQTELATLRYQLPRLQGLGEALSRQGGGGGGGGASGFATGGFTSGPSIAGEDPRYPTEAVISFNPAYRAQNLSYWARAGEMLGAMDEGSYEPISSGSGTSVVYDLSGLSFSPKIEIQGDTDEDALIRKLRDLEPEFIDFILEALARREGGAYVTADSRLY